MTTIVLVISTAIMVSIVWYVMTKDAVKKGREAREQFWIIGERMNKVLKEKMELLGLLGKLFESYIIQYPAVDDFDNIKRYKLVIKVPGKSLQYLINLTRSIGEEEHLKHIRVVPFTCSQCKYENLKECEECVWKSKFEPK